MIKILLFPFAMLWGLTGLVFRLLGAVVSVALGSALVLVGGVITLTVIGSFLGIPLLLLGILLVLKAFF